MKIRATHKKYGFGYIIPDECGDCMEDEVIFRPDNGYPDRCDPNLNNTSYAKFIPAKIDIIKKIEITIL